MINEVTTRIARTKALQSVCRYRISAIAFSKKGQIVYKTTNKPRFKRAGGSLHAEMNCIANSPIKPHSILICRVNSKGKILAIKPCSRCSLVAKKLKIKILTVKV